MQELDAFRGVWCCQHQVTRGVHIWAEDYLPDMVRFSSLENFLCQVELLPVAAIGELSAAMGDFMLCSARFLRSGGVTATEHELLVNVWRPINHERSGAVVSVLGSQPKGPWIETTLRYFIVMRCNHANST